MRLGCFVEQNQNMKEGTVRGAVAARTDVEQTGLCRRFFFWRKIKIRNKANSFALKNVRPSGVWRFFFYEKKMKVCRSPLR